MAPDDDPALETRQQVLAVRLDRLGRATVDPRCDISRLGARVRRLDLEALPTTAGAGAQHGEIYPFGTEPSLSYCFPLMATS